jgi:peptide/nickel transport system ATP-binding protein
MQHNPLAQPLRDLQVAFRMGGRCGAVTRMAGVAQRADAQGISFDIRENSTVALVGESGSGKSVTAMSILNLLPDNAERSGASCGRAATCCRPLHELQRCAARTSPASSRTR